MPRLTAHDSMHVQYVEDRFAEAGLVCLGGFPLGAGDQAITDAAGGAGRWLLLIGNAGPAMWRSFAPTRGEDPDPLDRWTRTVIGPLAEGIGARVLYPFDGPPYWPFQAWAYRTGRIFRSPLGIAMHAQYGLWHAYRAALVLDEIVAGLPVSGVRSPCDGCADRPCLAACPVDAFDGASYAVDACRAHLGTGEGRSCRQTGCLARRACPVGERYRYTPEQAAFHMAAFSRLADEAP